MRTFIVSLSFELPEGATKEQRAAAFEDACAKASCFLIDLPAVPGRLLPMVVGGTLEDRDTGPSKWSATFTD